jgi:hypothetical protein
MNFTQVGILLFGIPAIWFVGRKEKWKRLGYIFGLCSQPFWMYASITNKQWGIFILTLFYTYSWIQGIYNYWIKKT